MIHPALDFRLLLLIGIANGTPVLATAVLGQRYSYPLDCGAMLRDGEPLFGKSKSFRGVTLALLFTAAAASILGLHWRIGVLVAALAMAGDVASSFLKRRMRLPASSMALGLDQLPESLLPMLGAAFVLPVTLADILVVVTVFFAGELVLSRLLFRWRLRDRPY